MVNCICLTQEGLAPDQHSQQLKDGLKQIVITNKLGDDVNIAWITVPPGEGWTDGKPSTSTVLSMEAPPIDQAHRVDVLTQICDLWIKTTGCHVNEIVASVVPAAAA